jgi:UDP-N-acetylmuramyl pentapeptide phosphotransferase/UDP-N-acetylglucosamine-1-phosphate transferase
MAVSEIIGLGAIYIIFGCFAVTGAIAFVCWSDLVDGLEGGVLAPIIVVAGLLLRLFER